MGNWLRKVRGDKSSIQVSRECPVDDEDTDDDNEEFTVISIQDVNLTSHEQELSNNESVAEKLSKVDEKCKILIENWKAIQNVLRLLHKLEGDIDLVPSLHHVGGVDISFPSNKNDLVHACACFVVMSYPDLDIVYKQCKIVHLTSIYVPEFLAFREVVPLKSLCDELKALHPELFPQVILVDGNGVLHPRKFGLACHLGVVMDTPTIGVAKKLFHVDGLEKNPKLKDRIKTLEVAGSSFDIIGNSGFTFGKVLRSTASASNPIYVSIGHKIGLETCIDLVTNCCKVRVPEPIRWADILSREYIRENYEEHARECKEYNELNEYFQKLAEAV